MNLSRIVCAALFISVATAGVVAAQPPAEFLAVYTITVKPGHTAQFEDFLTKLKAGADKIGLQQQWGVGQVTFGGPGGGYAIGLPFDKWGDMDAWKQAPQTLKEAYGDEEGAKIYRTGTMAIQTSETSVSRLDKALSYNANGGVGAPMIQVRVIRVHRDKQDQFRIVLNALNEAWKEAGDTRRVVRRTNVLGPSAVYTTARMLNSWSDLDGGGGGIWAAIEKTHGEMAARRMRVIFQEAVASSDAFVLAMRPDLSRMPMQTTSNE